MNYRPIYLYFLGGTSSVSKTGVHIVAYLDSIRLPEANANTGSEGPSRHTAHHHWHALLTGAVALQLYLSAKLAVGQVSLVAGTVDRETPVVLLTTLG